MEQSDKLSVLDFIRNNVIGRAVIAPPLRTTTDSGRLESVYEEDVVYSNLQESAVGFSFHLTNVSRGTRYLTQADRKDLIAEGTFNAVRVLKYDMTLRRSSGHYLGIARFISSTNTHPDPMAGAAFLVRMWMYGGSLIVEETMHGYVDILAADGGLRSLAIDGKYEYRIHDRSLVVTYQQATFDVDPKTLKRRPTGEAFPEQVSKETQFPAPLQIN